VDVSWTIRVALAAALAATALHALGKVETPSSQAVSNASCRWDRPGHAPFMGDVVKAVDFYRDISPDVRARLKARMAKRDYDDLVSIRRDSITGKAKYGTTIRDMHFGDGRVCRSVTREAWTASMQERGLVYCDSGQCILVPTVCRNVSRITRAEVSPDHAEAPAAGIVGGVGPNDAGPSFAGPDLLRGPLASGDSVGADLATPALLAGQPDTPDTPFETNVSPSGADSSTAPLPFGGPFLPGFAPTVLAPVVALPPGVRLPGEGGGDGAPPFGIPTPVPEPETWILMLPGLAALALLRRRARRQLPAADGSA
jgi:hypothetical protein